MMRTGSLFVRIGIPGKLYSVAVASLIALATLAWSSIHFASITEIAAQRLYYNGFINALNAQHLERLLEQHRRIVESAPAELDRGRLSQDLVSLDRAGDDLRKLTEAFRRRDGDDLVPSEELLVNIKQKLPELFQRGREVIAFARNFETDKAVDVAEGRYAGVADLIQTHLAEYRKAQIQIANDEISHLLASASTLGWYVVVGTGLAIFIIWPLGFVVIQSVISRLRRITNAMKRLANHDTAVDVPSSADPDEVGDMARAVEVFKANAIDLFRKKAEADAANLQLDAALNNMSQGLAMFDADQRLIVCNRRYAEIYGTSLDAIKPGATLQRLFELRRAAGIYADPTSERYIEECLAAAPKGGASDTVCELSDGRAIAVSHRPMAGGGWVSTHEDITERRRSEEHVSHMARHDALTDLPNRVLLRERMEQALARVLRNGEALSVLYLDLDHFKDVNDTLGHAVGDLLLRGVAERLAECVRDTDTVARLGGDEFAVLQVKVEQSSHATALAERLVEAIAQPFDLEGQQVIIGTSIGISLAPSDGTDSEQLMKNADMALYRAKAGGRGTFHFFEAEMDRRAQARRALELDLRKAVREGEFELHYQPLINVDKNEVSGFEALLRWRHPDRGMIAPPEFIPLAEDIGVIVPLGEWVLRQACADAARWPSHIKVAVNLSPVQFKSRNLAQTVLSALASSGLTPDRLELEITESVLLQDNERTLAILHQFRALGVHIAMDDFGTGYSSLSYLRSFPFDKIKIDRSFVTELTNRTDALAIVRAVTSLGNNLGMVTTAEGVETLEQLRQLRAEGCTEAQGFLFSPARPASEIPSLIAKIEGGRAAA